MPTQPKPLIHTSPYHCDPDFWRVRNLLIDAYPLCGPDFNWEIRRWDGMHTHRKVMEAGWEERFCLWETQEGHLVGAVHPEGSGDAHLEIHPDFRELIEEEMILWAEEHLAAPAADGLRRELHIEVFEYDSPRKRLLAKRGFEKTQNGWVVRRMRFGKHALPPPDLAEGYLLRTTRPDDMEDCQRIADVLNAGFNRPGFHTAEEVNNFITKSPSFRHDLNLVAEAPDGSFAAHVGVTYDEANRRGIFEPVCTAPDHRRKSLARSLMFEGLHRLHALGAADVYVATGDAVAANALYESVGFTEAYQGFDWRKIF